MLPDNLQILTVREIVDYITNIDERDLAENFASDIRGLRLARTGLVAERDFGTINRYAAANYPSTPSAITQIDGFPLFIPADNKTYDLVVGLDTSNNTRLYVGEEVAGTFEELTRVYTIQIGSITSLTITSTTDTLNDHLGVPVAASLGANYFQDYIAVNVNQGKAALVTASGAYGGSGTVTITLMNKPDIALGWSANDQIHLFRFTGICPDEALGTDRGYQFDNDTAPHLRFLSTEAQQKLTMFYGDGGTTPITPRQPIQIRKGRYLTPNSFTMGGVESGWEQLLWPAIGPAFVFDVGLAGRTITGATTATPIEISLAAHGLLTGATVYISGIEGIPEANGEWVITSTGAGTFTLDSSVGVGTYTTGGRVEYLWSVVASSDIYYSLDGGTTWTFQKACGFSNTQYKIDMVDYLTGYTCGRNGTVFKTVDGGTTWNDVGSPSASAITATDDLYDMSVISATALVVMSRNKVFITADSGTTWTEIANTMPSPSPPTFVYFFAINALDANTIWVLDGIGVGYIRKTTNGGGAWTNTVAPNPGSPIGLYDIDFFDLNDGWICGQYGYVYKSTDGGATWAYQATGITATTQHISIVDASNVRVCADTGGIAVTSNGGASWQVESTPTTDQLLSIKLFDVDHGYSVGVNGRVLRLDGSAGIVGAGSGDGWYIDKEQLLPDFEEVGTVGAPLQGNNGDVTITLGEGLRLTFSFAEEGDSGYQNNLRMYGTMLYADFNGETIHQESDPVFKLSLRPTGNNTWAKPVIKVEMNPAIINKNFLGMRFYAAVSNQNDLSYTEWVDDGGEYLQAYELLTTSIGWTLDTDEEYCLYNSVDEFKAADIDQIYASGPSNILDNLNHGIDTNRAYMTPRFGVKASRQQGSVVIVDEGDRNARLSCYDGDGVHQESNFPDVTVDNQGERQQIELTGHGELLGIAVMRGVAHFFKSTELERYDLQSGIRDIIPVDFYGKKSLLSVGVSDNPNGLMWAGNSGIYYLPINGGKPLMVSENIKNLFDGSLMNTAGTAPLVTDAYRNAIIAGYDLTFREAWIHMQVAKPGGGSEYLNFRYNFDVKKFFVRELNVSGTSVKFFYPRSDDHSFTIGTSAAILRYPYRQPIGAAHQYEDDVTKAGASQSKGIPTKIRINFGSLYGLQISPVLWDFIFDYVASVVSSEAVTIKLFANGIVTAFDTKTWALDNVKAVPMLVEAIGQVESLEMEISLLDANLHNYKKLEIRQIDLRYLKQPRIGIE